jgi:putative tryptophan/tyrosine transport system substrate-binding protein
MKRREFIALVASAAVTWPIAGHAQESKQGPVLIGWLAIVSRESGAHFLAAFKHELSALGWKEGAHVVVEDRWADGQIDRLQALAEELAAMKPAVIVAFPSLAVTAAAKAAPQTAIVHATGVNPLAVGFAAGLARPGGMVTGISNEATDFTEKHLELLLTIAPKLRWIGFLNDSTIPNRMALMEAVLPPCRPQGCGGLPSLSTMCRVAIHRALSLIVSSEMPNCLYRVGFPTRRRASERSLRASRRSIVSHGGVAG